jgi:glycosyltransferase involved in cell wall biosynthesis
MAVISADCRAGPSELIEDGVNGRLVPVDDVDALTRVMAELMASPRSREALGREARQVRQRFGQAQIMEAWRGCVLPGSSWAPAADRRA